MEAPSGRRKNGQKVDPDADFRHKGHGYCVHVNCNEDKLIETLEVTSARPHDSQHISDVTGKETAIYADSAYWSLAYVAMLCELGIMCGILEKATRNTPLSEEQKLSNRAKSRIRCLVEHIFACWKEKQGFRRVRYVGVLANRCDAFMHAVAYNIRRAAFLRRSVA